MKAVNNILLIDKREKDFLVANGVRFGENGISKTVASGKRATYYLTESDDNKELHEQYLKSIIAK